MHSVSAPGIRRSTRRASRSRAANFLARAGLTARGVIYILIGWVAVLVALGHSSREADQQGALQMLAGTSYGLVSLWLLAIGFAGYALWRLSEAAFGVTGEPPGAGPGLKSLARAGVYAGLCYLTISVISGKNRSLSGRQQDMTASAMHHADGRVLVGVVGLAIVMSGALYFADRRMKTDDNHFRGFPALWNAAAFYLQLLKPSPVLGTIVLAVFVGLTFVPFHTLHPLRTLRWRPLTLALIGIWAVLTIFTVVVDFNVPTLVKIALCGIAGYVLFSDLVVQTYTRIRP